MINILKKIFLNSWVKTFFFLALCFLGTYLLIMNFWPILTTFFDIRSKNFWIALGVIVPIMFLIPTFINMVLFAKIVQIADNTKQTERLLAQQNELLKQILNKK
ncbi:MAG: hypothetical protein ACRCS8_01820 [Brevinema sp.]